MLVGNLHKNNASDMFAPKADGGVSITVVILTYNEELHIERAILSVARFASAVVVVDSYSEDRTVEIATGLGASVVQRRFDNQARQFQWALDNVAFATEWTMRLDADEVISSELAEEILSSLPKMPLTTVGVSLARQQIFMGRWIKFGGRYPLHLLRIWRTGQAHVEDRWMDEHVVVNAGAIDSLLSPFADENLRDISYFIEKHNKYATREAVEQLVLEYNLWGRKLDTGHSVTQASMRRAIKERIYRRMPLWGGPLSYFLYRYFLLGGFLDGIEGLIYHYFQGFWYRFLVAVKVYEWRRSLDDCSDASERLARLETLTGLSLLKGTHP